MVFIIYAALIIFVVLLVFVIIAFNNKKNQINNLKQNLLALEQVRTKLDSQLNECYIDKGVMQKKIEELIADNASSKSKIDSLKEYNDKIIRELDSHKSSYKTVQDNLYKKTQDLEIKNQEMIEFKKRVSDWETSRTEAITQAKAAIFETASKLSDELVAKHKQETQDSEKKLQSSTHQLHEQFEKIIKMVSILDSDVKSSKETSDQIKQSLLSPAGAGSLAEITLENILKSSGLDPNRDFIMQYSFNCKVENKRLRPDAVLFLPAKNVMIIDSKASKYFMEISNVANEDAREEVNRKLKATMRSHLNDLSTKDYQESLREFLKDKNINRISSIMFLPSESAVETLSKIDKNFLQDAWERDIFPVGPAGLINILNHTKFQLAITKQNDNHVLIIEEIRKFLGALSSLYTHAKKLGSSLYSAGNHFDKFAASFNVNLLPKAKNLEKLGVHLQKNKSLPSAIDRFTMISSSKLDLIEVDSEQSNQEEKV